jgi:hypothetical protein
MNFKAFLFAVVTIIVVAVVYVLYSSRQPLEPEGSLTNVELSPTKAGEPEPTISSTVQGLP